MPRLRYRAPGGRHDLVSRSPDVPCAKCGKLLYSTPQSLPAGQRTCQPCRRQRIKGFCETCGEPITGWGSRFCSRVCSSQARRQREWDRRGDKNLRLCRSDRQAIVAQLMTRQRGHCAICGNNMDAPHLDHDHNTGALRELLCRSCNLGLGYFRDSPAILSAAIDYLRRHTPRLWGVVS